MMRKIVKVGLVAVSMIFLLSIASSCSKEKFRLFDDLDCVVKENFVRIELPITDISPSGGKIKLEANVYMEIVSYKMGQELSKEYVPLDFTVQLVKAPIGYELEVINRDLIITAPSNLTKETYPIEISITAGGVTKNFVLTQKPRMYELGGTII